MYLVAPLARELHDLDPAVDVFPLLRAYPDHEPTVGLGFQQDGLQQPAALILHSVDLLDLVDDVRARIGGHVELIDDDEYERRALEQATTDNGLDVDETTDGEVH